MNMAKRKTTESVTRSITLRGITDIMFDRYAGDNKTQLRPDQKMYLMGDKRQLVLPSLNVVSLLSAQNTPSAPKRFLDSRTYKKVAQAILSFTAIEPFEIPFLRNGKPIFFGEFGADEIDPQSGVYVNHGVARLDKGIPNPKERPTLPMPWSLAFKLHYYPNDEVQEETIQNLLIKAGVAIGLGTFRGVFGKFEVTAWE
jgi:hypothetical protein